MSVNQSNMDSFVSDLNVIYGENSNPVLGRVFEYVYGRKWIKVTVRYAREASGSVYAFIDAANGDIYKPASWRAPAKHARGNIFTNRNCCGKFGIAYLR